MRVAPVAYAMGRSEEAREQLTAVCRATHQEEVSIHAALAVAEPAWVLGDGVRGAAALQEIIGRLPEGAVRNALQAAAGASQPLLALEGANR